MVSAACGWNYLVEKLLQRGCSIDFVMKRPSWSSKRNLPRLSGICSGQYPSLLALVAHRGHYNTFKFCETEASVIESLLNRINVPGRSPIRKLEVFGDTPLTEASEAGNKKLVRMMLAKLDDRIIPLEKLRLELDRAEQMAERGLEKFVKVDVRPLLRRFYWHKKYEKIIVLTLKQK